MTNASISERHHDIRQHGLKISWQPAFGDYILMDGNILIGTAENMLEAVESCENYILARCQK